MEISNFFTFTLIQTNIATNYIYTYTSVAIVWQILAHFLF